MSNPKDFFQNPLPPPTPAVSAWKIALLGFSIVMTLAGTFWLGGYYSCTSGGGEVLGFPLPRCVEIQTVGACNIGEEQYVIPEQVESGYQLNLPNLTVVE